MKASNNTDVTSPVNRVQEKVGRRSEEDMPAKEPHMAAWPRPGLMSEPASVTAALAKTGLEQIASVEEWAYEVRRQAMTVMEMRAAASG